MTVEDVTVVCANPCCCSSFVPDKPGRRYCSVDCYYEARKGVARLDLRKRETRTCETCGGEYEVGGRTGRLRTSRFCSRAHARAARWRTGSTASVLNLAQAAYLAGIVDGEGSIILYRRGRGASLRLAVASTDTRLLDWCVATTGVGGFLMKPRANPNHKASGQWACNSQAAESVISQLEPFLVIKREQAALALDFMRRLRMPADKARSDWQEEYRQAMARMNRRGPVELQVVEGGLGA